MLKIREKRKNRKSCFAVRMEWVNIVFKALNYNRINFHLKFGLMFVNTSSLSTNGSHLF